MMFVKRVRIWLQAQWAFIRLIPRFLQLSDDEQEDFVEWIELMQAYNRQHPGEKMPNEMYDRLYAEVQQRRSTK